MTGKSIILLLLLSSIIITAVSSFRIITMEHDWQALHREKEKLARLERTLCTPSSLDEAIAEREKEKAAMDTFYRYKGKSDLAMTREVLELFKRNRIKISRYRIEGENDRKELAVDAEGKTENILKLIYDLSALNPGFFITFITVNAETPEKPAALVIRISHV